MLSSNYYTSSTRPIPNFVLTQARVGDYAGYAAMSNRGPEGRTRPLKICRRPLEIILEGSVGPQEIFRRLLWPDTLPAAPKILFARKFVFCARKKNFARICSSRGLKFLRASHALCFLVCRESWQLPNIQPRNSCPPKLGGS